MHCQRNQISCGGTRKKKQKKNRMGARGRSVAARWSGGPRAAPLRPPSLPLPFRPSFRDISGNHPSAPREVQPPMLLRGGSHRSTSHSHCPFAAFGCVPCHALASNPLTPVPAPRPPRVALAIVSPNHRSHYPHPRSNHASADAAAREPLAVASEEPTPVCPAILSWAVTRRQQSGAVATRLPVARPRLAGTVSCNIPL